MTPGEWLRISLLAMARYWCRRLENHSEKLACSQWHCAATAVALKNHERANAFNLVVVVVLLLLIIIIKYPQKASHCTSTQCITVFRTTMKAQNLVGIKPTLNNSADYTNISSSLTLLFGRHHSSRHVARLCHWNRWMILAHNITFTVLHSNSITHPS